MIDRTIYMLFRSQKISESAIQAIETELSTTPQTLLYFDICTEQSVRLIRALFDCHLLDSCCYLHESAEISDKESNLLSQAIPNRSALYDCCCADFGKTSYMRQRRHRRFVEQSDYLLVIYDKPLAEINNTIRYAALLHKPVIQISLDHLHF